MTLGSCKACRRDQRVGFERGSVVGETFDGIFDELPGESHLSGVIQNCRRGNKREMTFEVDGQVFAGRR
jgi:hypothetical protein